MTHRREHARPIVSGLASLLCVALLAPAGWAGFFLDVDGPGLEAAAPNPVTFNPTRTPRTISGTGLNIPASSDGATNPSELFRIGVLPSGIVSSSESFSFEATVVFDALQTAADPVIALTDGNRFYGGSLRNASLPFPPFINANQFLGTGGSASTLDGLTGGSADFNIGDADAMELRLSVRSLPTGRTQSTFTFVNDAGADGVVTTTSTSSSDDLDPSAGFEFVFASDFFDEGFRVDSVTASLVVPEPAVLALTGIGGLLLSRRWRGV